MATPNADNTQNDPNALARRNERIRLVADRDSVARELQLIRRAAAVELRVNQMLNRNGSTDNLARIQASVVAMERQLQKIEQAIADADHEAEQPLQQENVTGTQATNQSTGDIRPNQSQRQQGSFRRPFRVEKSPQQPLSSSGSPNRAISTSRMRTLGTTDPQIKAAAQKVRLAQGAFQRSHKNREDERVSITKQIKKTGMLILWFALWIAVVSDLLSIIDFGWVTSWIIPIVSWFMVRRINAMMKAPEKIADAVARLRRQSVILRQRIAPLLPAAQRGKFLATQRIGQLSAAASSYISTWIRDSIITQLLELIPVVDILPMYLGQVVKMIINQNVEHQKVQKLMPTYERAIATVESLELLEIEQLQKRLARLAQKRNIELAELREVLAQAGDAPRQLGGSVTDIARPGSGVAPVRQFQTRQTPTVAVPMRDVAAAA